MVERLSDKEREIINTNWDTIKTKALENPIANIKIGDCIIKTKKEDEIIKLEINQKEKGTTLIRASEKSKIMTFKTKDEKNNNVEKKELIYEAKTITYFIRNLKMKHPIFKKEENDEILNKSVTNDNVEEVFNDPNINEIIDDRFESYITKNDFLNFKQGQEEISDYYDDFSFQEYSELADVITTKKSDKIVSSEKRKNLINFLVNINLLKEKIIILAGAQKIGITFSILQIVKFDSILYLDLKAMHPLKNKDKRKYIFNRFINLFAEFDTYYKFINDKILPIQGYDNFLLILEEIITNISKEEKLKSIIIIIDNYDDYLVGNKKLSSDFLDKIYDIIKDSFIKIVFVGRGKFISNLLIDFFYNKSNIKQYILFKYFSTLNLDIENIIHSHYKEKNNNEIELYYNENKEIQNESMILSLIMIKNLKNLINENFHENFPFQFFHFDKTEYGNLQIEYQFDDILKINNNKLRESFAKLNNININFNKVIPSVKGFLFEELVISILMNNKSSFKNLKINKNNIIEVESIYNLKDDVKPIDNLEKGPILIIQQKNGEVFDFGIIIDNSGVNYFIGGQIGLNKTNKEISAYQEKISSFNDNIKSNLGILTHRKIQELKFIIILNKEWQNALGKKFEQNNQKLNIYNDRYKNKKSKPTEIEAEEIKRLKKNISYYNSEYGIKCCENWNISYFLFSEKDFNLYIDEKKIENFDVNNIISFKTGFELFCIKEYNLIPFEDENPILNEKEKKEFIKTLQESYPDIKDIKINFKINGKINLLAATPENYGILSIYNDNKIFIYYDGKFTCFIIKENKVTKFENIEKINNFPFENDESLSRYFLEFIYDDEDEINFNKEKNDIKKEEKNSEMKIDEEMEENNKINDAKKIQKNKKNKGKKELQKKQNYINHIKYLQNKRKRDDEEDEEEE